MATYEVSYTVQDEVRSTLIDAASPSEATRIFYRQNREEGAVVLCVVKQ